MKQTAEQMEAELNRRELATVVVLQQHHPVQTPGEPVTLCWCGWRRTANYSWADHVARLIRNAGGLG